MSLPASQQEMPAATAGRRKRRLPEVGADGAAAPLQPLPHQEPLAGRWAGSKLGTQPSTLPPVLLPPLNAQRCAASREGRDALALLEKHGIISRCADGTTADRHDGDVADSDDEDGRSVGHNSGPLRLHLSAAFHVCAAVSDTPPPRRHTARALHLLLREASLPSAAAAAVVSVPTAAEAVAATPPRPDDVYSMLRRVTDGARPRPSLPLPPMPSLQPELRQYQRLAVEWMLAREQPPQRRPQPESQPQPTQLPNGDAGSGSAGSLRTDGVAQLWRRVLLPVADADSTEDGGSDSSRGGGNGQAIGRRNANGSASGRSDSGRSDSGGSGGGVGSVSFLWNPYTGALALDLPPAPQGVRGGILADEMGLGKTICVLALVVANPAPEDHRHPSAAASSSAERDPACAQRQTDAESITQVEASEEASGGRDTASAAGVGDSGGVSYSVAGSSGGGGGVGAGEIKSGMLVSGGSGSGSVVGQDRNGRNGVGSTDGGADTVSERDGGAEGGCPSRERDPIMSEAKRRGGHRGVDQGCFCRETPRANLPGATTLVECDKCGRWCHACCAGFVSAEAAEAAGEYVCLLCATSAGEKAPRKCAATLLVCPAAILGQWHGEVRRHVSAGELSVSVYTGLREAKQNARMQPHRLAEIQPHELASKDLILTTFEALRYDLTFSSSYTGALGHGLKTPLLSLHFWRVVLDEAQMVESSAAKAATMAQMLHATNRWAVSGTPMGKGRLADLHALFCFLGVQPWADRAWFKFAIETPLQPPVGALAEKPSQLTPASGAKRKRANVISTPPRSPQSAEEAAEACGPAAEAARALQLLLTELHRVMWRSTKKSVESQLGLPPQTLLTHTLSFSSIESHFYKKQHRECVTAAAVALRRHDSSSATDDAALEKLSMPLLRLRQACCHPQLGAFGLRAKRSSHASLSSSRSPMSMEAVLARLFEEEKTRCEEGHRKVLFNMSAIAAISTMEGNHTAAGAKYAEARALTKANRLPSPLAASVEVRLIGPSSFVGPAALTCNGATAFGPISWPATVNGDGDNGDAAPLQHAAEVGVTSGRWLRLELSKPRRLCQIALRLEAAAGNDLGCAQTAQTVWPRRCSLQASTGGEGSAVFVDVCEFECSLDRSGWQRFECYRPYKSKVWLLEVHTHGVFVDTPGSAQSGSSPSELHSDSFAQPESERRCHVSELQLFEAEVEVDPLQLLHVTHNFAQALRCSNLMHAPAEADADANGSRRRGARGEIERNRSQSKRGSDAALLADEDASAGNVSSARPSASDAPAAPGEDEAVPAPEPWPTPSALLAECETLRRQMVGERAAVQRSQRLSLQEASRETDAAAQVASSLDWMEELFRLLKHDHTRSHALRERLQADANVGDAVRSRFGSWPLLLQATKAERHQRFSARRELLAALKSLSPHPSEDEVAESGNCGQCRRDWGKTGPSCRHCMLEDKYTAYEATLFYYRRQRKVELAAAALVADLGPGAAHANQTEAFRCTNHIIDIVRLIVRWLAGVSGGVGSGLWRTLYTKGSAEVELLSLMARELRCVHLLWSAHFNLLSQLDEVASATTTMQLAESPNEVMARPEAERHVLVGLWEIDERRAEYVGQLADAHHELRLAKAQYRYLRQLAAGGPAAADCPVCLQPVGEERMVSSCGHSLCAGCTDQILRRRSGRFVCPLCMRPGSVSLATHLQWRDGSSAGTAVVGSWGTKVTAVVEQVLALPAQQKCLVFSQWEDMLTMLAAAFDANSISHCRIAGRAKLEERLAAFRTDETIRALLLPLTSGANGLNLVEAQHVLLVEPLLNSEVEAQAIGRVHRISQALPTTVHRFVVQGTVEEAIHRMRQPANGEAEADARLGTSVSPGKAQSLLEESRRLTWAQLRQLFQDEIDLVREDIQEPEVSDSAHRLPTHPPPPDT